MSARAEDRDRDRDMALDIPQPGQFGLPDKFDRWRRLQWQAIEAAIDSPKRFVVQCMPTGSGKSLVYMAQAQISGLRTVILTSTKGLQGQLVQDFGEMGLKEVRGQGSYPCKAVQPGEELARYAPDPAIRRRMGLPEVVGCDEGPCKWKVKCGLKGGGCDYYDAVKEAERSQLVVANYAYWMTSNRFGRGLGKFDLLVMDEAHDAPDQVSKFMEVDIEDWEAQALLNSRLLDEGATFDQWKAWADYHLPRALVKLAAVQEEMAGRVEEGRGIPEDMRREQKRLDKLVGKLGMLAKAPEEWIIERARERGQQHVKFCPVWPGPYTEGSLFLQIPKVVMVSATIMPKTLQYLGVRKEDTDFKEYPSSFPTERRPIWHVPTIALTHRTPESGVRVWLSRIEQIVRSRPERKGIVHSVSFRRAQTVMLNVDAETQERMVTHSSVSTRTAVERFKRMPADSGAVLVSPSVTTGYDFPYDQCEWQIVGKVPFPDATGALVKARTAQDGEYAMYLAMQTLIQMVGRGMRAADDQCETFIIDNNIQWFLWKFEHFAPKWFKDAYRKVMTIPKAMEKLPRRTDRERKVTTAALRNDRVKQLAEEVGPLLKSLRPMASYTPIDDDDIPF